MAPLHPTTSTTAHVATSDVETGSEKAPRKSPSRASKRAKWALFALLVGAILACILGSLTAANVGPFSRRDVTYTHGSTMKRAAAASMPHKQNTGPLPPLSAIESSTSSPTASPPATPIVLASPTEVATPQPLKRHFGLLHDMFTFPIRIIAPLLASEVWKPGATALGKPGGSDVSWGMLDERDLHVDWPGEENPFYFSFLNPKVCGPLDSFLGTCGRDWSFKDGPEMRPIPEEE